MATHDISKITLPNGDICNLRDSRVPGLLDLFYPVGSYYETSNANFDPNTAWGGTWELEAEGKVHVSAGSTYTIGYSYGSDTHTHTTGDVTLTVDQIPSHRHELDMLFNNSTTPGGQYVVWGRENGGAKYTKYEGGGKAHNHGSTGSSTRNSWQPSTAVNRWHRTA